MFVLLRRLFGWCPHREMVCEHRELYGRPVMFYVCDCGYAVPVVNRTEEEIAALPARPRRI